jgi:HK97 family phage prohead protease
MSYERRTTTGDVELREEDETLTAVGYASVWDRLSQNLGGFVERVLPGSFRSTIGQSDVRALYNHEPDHLLGRSGNGTLTMEEDDVGLRYSISLPQTQLGRDVAELLRRGDLVGSSIGFRVINGGEHWGETDDGYPLRTLSEVALRDLGPVTFPAFSDTSASLRSLAEGRSLDLDVLVRAAEDNVLRDVLFPPEADAEEEPGATHSFVRRSWGFR